MVPSHDKKRDRTSNTEAHQRIWICLMTISDSPRQSVYAHIDIVATFSELNSFALSHNTAPRSCFETVLGQDYYKPPEAFETYQGPQFSCKP